jgi:hypothetical protein
MRCGVDGEFERPPDSRTAAPTRAGELGAGRAVTIPLGALVPVQSGPLGARVCSWPEPPPR